MNKLIWLVMAIGLAACGEDDPPNCQIAITHFYSVGCTFVGTNGQPTSMTDASTACNTIDMEVPDQCRDEFDDWRQCLFDVRNDMQCGSCVEETDTLFACQ